MTRKAKARKRLFTTVWEFRVPDRQGRAFEKAYSPDGAWAQLFRSGEGYIRTELLRDRETPGRYLTIDYWASRRAFVNFKEQKCAEYKVLDKKCEALTQKEKMLGEFESWEPS
jgi:heme-degrading monooxygenase HmoA